MAASCPAVAEDEADTHGFNILCWLEARRVRYTFLIQPVLIPHTRGMLIVIVSTSGFNLDACPSHFGQFPDT